MIKKDEILKLENCKHFRAKINVVTGRDKLYCFLKGAKAAINCENCLDFCESANVKKDCFTYRETRDGEAFCDGMSHLYCCFEKCNFYKKK